MKGYGEEFYDTIFLSYKKILKRFKMLGICKNNGDEITHLDLRKAVQVMIAKHPSCRWRSEKLNSKKYYVLIEGFYWLMNVYFGKGKTFIDRDIDFFKKRIEQYEELLNIEHNENWWNKDMDIKTMCKYFSRKDITVRKAIKKMCDSGFGEYKTLRDGKVVVSSMGVEWICKNVFKQKYLELLEKYKMQLTEKYIKAGYIYDHFLTRINCKYLEAPVEKNVVL